MSVILIDTDVDALTISWPSVPGAQRYELHSKKANHPDDEFELLSNKLTATQARKKNLVDPEGTGFYFRVRAVREDNNQEDDADWISHETPFNLLTSTQAATRMEAPRVVLGGTSHSVQISWNKNDDQGPYEIQMRENVGGREWNTIAPSFAGSEVRKKNLHEPEGYQFRVRATTNDDDDAPFSPPSQVIVPLGLSAGIQRLFGTLEKGTLLKGPQAVPLEQALGGKEFVLLYASAHWCGPCRSFTPKLSQWYTSLIKSSSSSPVEIVFLSADHDEKGFQQYYGTMPWLAIDYEDDTREQLMAHIRVTGIPRLAVLDGKTGRILEDNAVGKPFDIARWRSLATR